jgi:hypothetical protein
MTPVLPFTLRAASESEMAGTDLAWDAYRFHGVARIDGDELVLEWGGEIERSTMEGTSMSTTIDPVPTRRVRVPGGRLGTAELRGGWWRPRLEVVVADLDALAALPGSRQGRAVLRIARRDRGLALESAAGLDGLRASAP